VPGVLASAQRFGLTVEKLSPRDVATRWPGLRVDDAHVGVYEPGAGYLRVEECILAHQEAAAQRGAELRCHTAVRNWTADGQGVTVQTDGATFSAGRLVIAAGPWASLLLGDLGVPLVVRRKPQYWVATRDDAYGAAAGHPAYLFETAAGVFYGFPQIDDRGIKVARHTGGDSVSDPSLVDRQLDPADWQSVAGFVSRHLPRATARLTTHSTCMYTMTPDEHFIVDRHPRHAQVALAAGLSGHGFKFTPVLGEALADLALDGASELPIEFLSLRRFAAQ
jgi:monomeric sarcosine oxidase